MRVSVERPDYDAAVNVGGTIRVLEAARPVGAQLVFSSTGGAIYGERTSPAPEDTPREPLAPYGTSKLCGEEYLATYNRLYGTSHVSLRFGNVYGPRQDPHGEAGVVAIFFGLLRSGGAPKIFGDGLQTRDYVYVGDVAQATLAAVGQAGGVFNIGTGIETSVVDLFGACRTVAGVEHRRRTCSGSRRRAAAKRARSEPGRKRAGLAPRDVPRGRAPRDLALRRRLTNGAQCSQPARRARRDIRRDSRRLLARRGGHGHLGARAGPAPDRERLRAGQRLRLPHLRAVGCAVVPPDRGARLRGGTAGSRVLPGLSRRRACARLGDRLHARRRRAHLARRGCSRGLGAGGDREADSRRARRERRRPLPRPLPRRLRLHGALLRRTLPRPRRRLVPRRDPRQGRHRGSARRTRDGDAAARARALARARRAALARP